MQQSDSYPFLSAYLTRFLTSACSSFVKILSRYFTGHLHEGGSSLCYLLFLSGSVEQLPDHGGDLTILLHQFAVAHGKTPSTPECGPQTHAQGDTWGIHRFSPLKRA